MIDLIALWFARAKPNPTDRDVDIQLGAHFEEFVEMLESLKGRTGVAEVLLGEAEQAVRRLSTELKKGAISVHITNREEFLDACCDQIVTSTGSAKLAGMKIVEALTEVNSSNWSKFAPDGTAIFDGNGKIAKNRETYRKPNLEGLY